MCNPAVAPPPAIQHSWECCLLTVLFFFFFFCYNQYLIILGLLGGSGILYSSYFLQNRQKYTLIVFMINPNYRKILHISYKDHVTNEEVRAKIQQAIGPHKDLLTIAAALSSYLWILLSVPIASSPSSSHHLSHALAITMVSFSTDFDAGCPDLDRFSSTVHV